MVTLKELRQYVRSQLIQEANVIGLANRQLGHIAFTLLKSSSSGRVSLIALSTSKIVVHEGTPIPLVLGYAQVKHEYDGNYRLKLLYGDNAVVSVVLLAGALEHWKSVFADNNVSPAAQQVIKRYFEQNKDNRALIERDADVNRDKHAPDFLRAAYLGPVGFDIETALKEGDRVINKAAASSNEWTRDDVVDMIRDAAENGFQRAHADISKTRHSLDDLLNEPAPVELLSELVKAVQKGGEAQMKALTWLTDHEEDVYELLVKSHPNMKDWGRIVQPALDKLNYEA